MSQVPTRSAYSSLYDLFPAGIVLLSSLAIWILLRILKGVPTLVSVTGVFAAPKGFLEVSIQRYADISLTYAIELVYVTTADSAAMRTSSRLLLWLPVVPRVLRVISTRIPSICAWFQLPLKVAECLAYEPVPGLTVTAAVRTPPKRSCTLNVSF